ncbi:MAG TPA: hypothetical protein VGN51_08760 [Acidimicrobiia bacterium]
MRVRVWTCGVVALVAAVGFVLLPTPAGAHPSPLDSLTLDFIVDQSGLVVIDGAANRATYDSDAPSPAERSGIVDQVVEALGIPRDAAQVDAANSTLYHEVGFRVSLHAPFANTADGGVRIDPSALQPIAASLGTLTLDVCRVVAPELNLTVDAAVPASQPDPSGAGAPQTDRADCHTWALHAEDPPMVVTAHVTGTSASEPITERHVTLPCGAPSPGGDPTYTIDYPVMYPKRVLQAHATGAAGSQLLQADVVVGFWAHTESEVVVPKAQIGHVSIGIRDGPSATRRLSAPKCPPEDPSDSWTMLVMRIRVDHAACVPFTVTARNTTTIRLAVGAPCKVRA